MRAGILRYVQAGPGFPRDIPISEYERLGYGPVSDEM
jgi:hypothetical protein